MTRNMFVLGLDRHNHEILRRLPGAEDLTFHQLIPRHELQGAEVDVLHLLDRAEAQLEQFDGSIDAIVSFWDFPMVVMVPILCERRGLPAADLSSVLRCEHKFWTRRVQSQAISEIPAYGLLNLDTPTLPEGMQYPVWIKPVMSASSQGAYRITNEAELHGRLPQVRSVIDRLGSPFQDILNMVDLPPEIAAAGGRACLVEEAVTGRQMTLEGFSHDGVVSVYGVVDSHHYPGSPSFLRYQYPSQVPLPVQEHMIDVAQRAIKATGLYESTFNVEFFWDKATAILRLLEVNARHSQSHAAMFEMVDGVSNHEVMVDLAFGRTPRLPHRAGPYAVAAHWFLRRFRDGIVRRVPTAEQVKALEGGLPGTQVEIMTAPGRRLSEQLGEDGYSYVLARVLTGGADEDAIARTYARCVEALEFEIDEVGA